MTVDSQQPLLRDMSRHLPHGGWLFLERLGVSFSHAEEGVSEGIWTPGDVASNPNGGVQGGLWGCVFDAAMSMAIHSALSAAESCLSLEIKTSTLGGARAGDTLQLRGRVLRLGGTAIFAEATAYRGDELIATGNGSFLRRRKPPRPARD